MDTPAGQDTVIGRVVRQRREEVRVTVRRANGRKLLDVRIWIENELGQLIPTPRGVSLRPAEWTTLRQVLDGLKNRKGGEHGRE
jgi:Transcriptional Coactivator p15 (PC4)